jgi:formylmethanofuran dehydrogenase subunit E
MAERDTELQTAIKRAEDMHGHLGPFLVIGVRMGKAAMRSLNLTAEESGRLQVVVKVPLRTPFSCVLDGIQTTTKCTVGNQKLKMRNQEKGIGAEFSVQGSGKTVRVQVNPETIESMMTKMAEGTVPEEAAREIEEAPESQLFTVDRR